MTDETIGRIVAMRRARMSCREIGTALFYTRSAIAYALKRHAPELRRIGLRAGPPTTRMAEAAALRAAGLPWSEIADRLGYSDEGTAVHAVRTYTGRPVMARGHAFGTEYERCPSCGNPTPA